MFSMLSSLSILPFDALTVPAGTDDDELLKKLLILGNRIAKSVSFVVVVAVVDGGS